MDARDRRPDEGEAVPPGHEAPSASAAQALRKQAEARFRETAAQSPQDIEALSPEATRHMLHELQVHQIELEMQNEELRESQAALDAVRARYFDLYDLAPVGYCTVSEQGLILQSNLTIANLLGMARGALVRQPLFRLILKEDQDIYYLLRKQLIDSGKPQSCDLRMVKPDGTQFWAHLAASIAQEDQAPTLRIVLSDISGRKQVEAERQLLDQALRDKNVELARTTVVAEKANLAKSEFLSSMSHELRTPLHAILGFAQLIEAGSPQPTPGQKRSVDQILKAGWFLLEMINEILDLAVIESGKLSLLLEPVSLADILRECEAMMEPQAEKRGISMAFARIKTPVFIRAERMRVKQVLVNLLSNAIKYNKVGGTVSVECSLRAPDSIRISVRDTGAGLVAEQLAQLFQPFNRLGQEAHVEEGTGIGLMVCKRLVELMQGGIGVDSTVGEGSTFWIELRLATEPQAASLAAESTAVTRTVAEGEVALHTLLYVEDNPANLMLVEDIIARRPDIRLLSARDGNSGIGLARAALPDVILMDINLPGISGIAAMKILAEDSRTAHIPVIALSANALPRDIGQGLKAGFFSYLTKPIKIDEFMDTLEAALKSF